MFIGLNPSTADETTDDPTLVRCMNFAKAWGYGGVCMANLFAYRATDPADMKAATNPIGSQNNKWLKVLAKDAGLIIGAWGNDGAFMGRSAQVKKRVPAMRCLKMNKSGEPAHPLYQRADVIPVELVY